MMWEVQLGSTVDCGGGGRGVEVDAVVAVLLTTMPRLKRNSVVSNGLIRHGISLRGKKATYSK